MKVKNGHTKILSVCKSLANVLIGMASGYLFIAVIGPWIGIELDSDKNLTLMIALTLLSMVRQYSIDRVFNKFYADELKTYLKEKKKRIEELKTEVAELQSTLQEEEAELDER